MEPTKIQFQQYHDQLVDAPSLLVNEAIPQAQNPLTEYLADQKNNGITMKGSLIQIKYEE